MDMLRGEVSKERWALGYISADVAASFSSSFAGRAGHIYVLSGKGFSKITFGAALEAQTDAKGKIFISGARGFIRDVLNEPGLLGFTPVNLDACSALVDAGLTVVDTGEVNVGREVGGGFRPALWFKTS